MIFPEGLLCVRHLTQQYLEKKQRLFLLTRRSIIGGIVTLYLLTIGIVEPWLIHVNVWHKPLQYCKVISLQLIKINEKNKQFEHNKKNKKNKEWEYMSSYACL